MNLWPRRIITGVGLLVVVVALVLGVVRLVGMVGGSGSGAGAAGAAQSGTAQSGSAQSGEDLTPVVPDTDSNLSHVDIATCTPDHLDAQVAVRGGDVAVGAGATVSVELTDSGHAQCSTDFGRVTLRVVSGDQTVYDSARCADRDTSSTPLLFAPGDSWKGTLSWDGGVFDGCTALKSGGARRVADAGTYRVQVDLDGKVLAPEVVFQVQ